eukprot:gene31678-6880_t
MQMNVSRFKVDAIHKAAHDYELQMSADGLTHVILDTAHMGVGGDDSWSPSVHQKYQVPPQIYSFSVGLAPVEYQR